MKKTALNEELGATSPKLFLQSKIVNNDTARAAKPKTALGLSGGVDSSVAAYLLLKAGYDVTGVFMQCWDFKADGCKADEDRAFAVETAAQLGIKFEHLDYRNEYKAKVMNYFYGEYRAGRTPNPDVMCNKEIKFGLFFDWAMNNGFDYVATGHYARIRKRFKAAKKDDAVFELLKGKDSAKDQSYFLYLLNQNQLAKTLFPVGNTTKMAVRKLASALKLPTAVRPDSTGICFIGEVNIKDFLKKKIKPIKGNVLDSSGTIIGEHEGVWFYTVGQRHGFSVNKYFGHPLYVIGKNIETNELIVGEEKEAYTNNFKVETLHWIQNNPLEEKNTFECNVRIRHLGKMYKSYVSKPDKDVIDVKTIEPVFAVAPGQSAVFYLGDVVLGGGIIS